MNTRIQPLTESQKDLITEHMDLVAQVIHKHIYRNLSDPDMSWDDLYQTGCLALCKAAQHHNVSKPFGPYAARTIRNALIDYCSKNLRYRQWIYTTDTLPDIPVSDDAILPLFEQELTTFVQEQGNHSAGIIQKGVFSLLLKSRGYTSAELSKEFGTSANSVRAWMSLASKKLREEPELYKLLA